MDEYSDKGLHQLLGFFHAKAGYDLGSLIEAMGLTEDEWAEEIRDEMFIDEKHLKEVDQYFINN